MIQVSVDMTMVVWLELSTFIQRVGCSNLGRDRPNFIKTGRDSSTAKRFVTNACDHLRSKLMPGVTI